MDVRWITLDNADRLDTKEEQEKFVQDAIALKDDIVSPGGAMADVSDLLNIYAVFVPSHIVCSTSPHLRDWGRH